MKKLFKEITASRVCMLIYSIGLSHSILHYFPSDYYINWLTVAVVFLGLGNYIQIDFYRARWVERAINNGQPDMEICNSILKDNCDLAIKNRLLEIEISKLKPK